MHDNRAALPLLLISAQSVDVCYELMYDSYLSAGTSKPPGART